MKNSISILALSALAVSQAQPAFAADPVPPSADDLKVISDVCTLNLIVSLSARSTKAVKSAIFNLYDRTSPYYNIDEAHVSSVHGAELSAILAGLNLGKSLDSDLTQVIGLDCYYGNFHSVLSKEESAVETATADATNQASQALQGQNLSYPEKIGQLAEVGAEASLNEAKKQGLQVQMAVREQFSKKDYSKVSFSKSSLLQGLNNSTDLTRNPIERSKKVHSLAEVQAFYYAGLNAIAAGTFDVWLSQF